MVSTLCQKRHGTLFCKRHFGGWPLTTAVQLWQFTWDKQLETWVKSTGILAGGKEPTIISPKQYMRRFRLAMNSYFTLVPAL